MFYLPFDNLTLYTLPLHRGFALIGIYSLKGSLLCLCVYIYMIWQSWMIIPNVAKDSNDDLGGCRSHQYEKYELFLLLLVFTLRAVWCQWEWLSLIWSSYSCPAHLLIKPKCSLKTSHFRQSMEGTLRIILDCIMQSYCGWLWKYKHGSGCKWILVPFLLSSRVLI